MGTRPERIEARLPAGCPFVFGYRAAAAAGCWSGPSGEEQLRDIVRNLKDSVSQFRL
jgi:hypothetical protein